MPCREPCLIVGKEGMFKIRRIGDNKIVTRRLKRSGIIDEIATTDMYPLAPWRAGHVVSSLCRRLGINLHPIDQYFGGSALGCHQSDQSGTTTHIENTATAGDIAPRTYQYAICAYFHGTTVVPHGKLLETKIGIAHLL